MTAPTPIFIVHGSHWSVPGTPTSLHFSAADADAAAADLVRVLFEDMRGLETALPAFENEAPWADQLHLLQVTRALECAFAGDDAEEVEARAAVQGDEWLADMAECDVWIEQRRVVMPEVAPPVPALGMRELGSVLAGLRLVQEQELSDDLLDIATDGGAFAQLSDDEIDSLCESLTVAAPPPIRIVLDMSGGIVQGATIDGGAIDLLVVDYDPCGGEDGIRDIPQPDGGTSRADVVALGAYDTDPAWVAAMFADQDAADAAADTDSEER